MTTVHRAILFSAADKYASQALGVATMAIMARILTPAETGLYLVASSLILLADNFRAFGVGVYIVQERDLDRRAVRAGFTVTLAISLAIGLAIWLAADAAAAFYGDAALTSLLRVAALAFAAIPFGSPVIALLQRDLAFRALAGVNVASACVAATVTVGLGAAGAGPVSYVWGYVASSVCAAALAFAVRPETWMFRLSLAGAGRVVSFGMTTSAVTLLNMVNDMLPRLAFGKMLGFDAVGLYGRAQTVCQLPDRAIGSALQPVVLPAMAALARSGRDLKPAYLRGLSLMTAVQWPALILLALLADPAVRVLLGPQWDAAAPLVRVIALGNLALAPAFMTFPVLVSAGRIRDTLFASLISLPPSAAILIGSASFGLTAVAASVLITAPLQMAVALLFIRRAIGVGWGEFFGAMCSSAVVACATAAAPITVILASPDGFDLSWPAAALAAMGGGAGWLAAIVLTGHPAAAEIGAVRTIAGSLVRATGPAPDPSGPISERSAP